MLGLGTAGLVWLIYPIVRDYHKFPQSYRDAFDDAYSHLSKSQIGPDDAALAVETFMAGLESLGDDYASYPSPTGRFWKYNDLCVNRMFDKLVDSGNLDASSLLIEKVGLFYEKVAAAWENALASSDSPSQHSADDVDSLLFRAIVCRISRSQTAMDRLDDPQAAKAIIDPAVDIARRRWPTVILPFRMQDLGAVYHDMDTKIRVALFIGMLDAVECPVGVRAGGQSIVNRAISILAQGLAKLQCGKHLESTLR